MRVNIATINQSHMLSAAGALAAQESLGRVYAATTTKRLIRDGIPPEFIRANVLPGVFNRLLHTVLRSHAARLASEPWHKRWMDAWLARHLEPSDVFISISSLATKAGTYAQRNGSFWIVDRPCAHIQTQDVLLRGVYEANGLSWPGISTEIIKRELNDYDNADAILVPSGFALNSFVERGIDPQKVWIVPYGVDLRQFQPVDKARSNEFKILFAGQKTLQKGIPTLLKGFADLEVASKRLTMVGADSLETRSIVEVAIERGGVTSLPSVSQAELAALMAEANVLVLPSEHDGFGMVVAQAMACGCPCIVSDHAGATDLIIDGRNGYVFPAGDASALASALTKVAQDVNPEELRKFSMETAANLGGWDTYATRLIEKCKEVINAR